MNALISIIIPIYKTENFLKTCIDSVLNQTYKNIEVILVDNASPDSCGQICDAYAAKDERVRVIHLKINKGPGAARNCGIDASKGQYIMFMDSDDYITSDMCERLLKNLNKEGAQLSIGGTFWVYPDYVKEESMQSAYRVITGEEAVEQYFLRNGTEGLLPAPWGKLFERNLFEVGKGYTSNIRFPENCLNEDRAIIYKLFYKAKKIVIERTPMYFYVQRIDGTSQGGDGIRLLPSLEKNIQEYYIWGKDKDSKLIAAIECRCINVFSNLVWEYLKRGSFNKAETTLQRLSDIIIKNTHDLSQNPYATVKEKRRLWLMKRHLLIRKQKMLFKIKKFVAKD